MIIKNFDDLQRVITQTNKSRRGLKNKKDYFEDIPYAAEEFLRKIQKIAKQYATKIVIHYIDAGEIDPKEKISLTFGNTTQKENQTLKSLEKENQNLKAENESLKKQLEKCRRGGRKGYDETMIQQVKSARASGETWRGLAARLGISTTTAQKLYKEK